MATRFVLESSHAVHGICVRLLVPLAALRLQGVCKWMLAMVVNSPSRRKGGAGVAVALAQVWTMKAS